MVLVRHSADDRQEQLDANSEAECGKQQPEASERSVQPMGNAKQMTRHHSQGASSSQ